MFKTWTTNFIKCSSLRSDDLGIFDIVTVEVFFESTWKLLLYLWIVTRSLQDNKPTQDKYTHIWVTLTQLSLSFLSQYLHVYLNMAALVQTGAIWTLLNYFILFFWCHNFTFCLSSWTMCVISLLGSLRTLPSLMNTTLITWNISIF